MTEWTDVSHYDGLTYWAPVGGQKIETLLSLVRLKPGSKAIDVGCGSGEVLLRLTELYEADVVGLDLSTEALKLARAAFDSRAPAANVELLNEDATHYAVADQSFDAVVWLGGPYLGGDFASTLIELTRWLRPGGYLLLGQGFWQQPPPAAYKEATGLSEDEFTEHHGTIEQGIASGLRLQYCVTSSRDEWDEFEGRIIYNVEQRALDHPNDPDPSGRLEQRRAWNLAQQHWGRETMGFGLYLFRKPIAE